MAPFNALNTVSVEGTVTTLPVNTGTVTVPVSSFVVTVAHRDGVVDIQVVATGALAVSTLRNVTVGRKVRLHGHLEGIGSGLGVHAETVAFPGWTSP